MFDIFNDLGLNKRVNNINSDGSTENIVITYLIDSSSSSIKKGNLVTFVNNNIKKLSIGEVPLAIALENGEPNQNIKCQLVGIVNLKGLFVPGAIYYNNENGDLTTTKPAELTKLIKEIGKALNSDELLLKDVFVNV